MPAIHVLMTIIAQQSNLMMVSVPHAAHSARIIWTVLTTQRIPMHVIAILSKQDVVQMENGMQI